MHISRLIPRASSRIVTLAWRASLALHLLGFVALAQSFSAVERLADEIELSGQRGVVTIHASIELPPPPLPEVELPLTDPPVVVTPRRAKVIDRTFVATPSADVAHLPASQWMADVADPTVPTFADSPRQRAEAEHAPTRSTDASPSARRVMASMPMIAGLEQGPDFAGNPPPEFPELARQNGWYGTVLLRLRIDAEGNVTEVRVEKSSGYQVFDAAAASAVKRWRGRPARRHAQNVASEELLPVVFRPR